MYYKTLTSPNSTEWVVFFHGFGGNSSIFYKQLKAFRSEYNLLLLDLPGHGKSPYPKGVDLFEYSAEKTMEILKQLNIKTAHFVGVSLGTIIMQEIALRKPTIIKSMVLGGATPKLKKWGEFLCRLSVFYPLRKTLPHMVPYRIFARVLLPKKNHSDSRKAFIKEAYKLSKETYLSWVLAGLNGYTTYDRLKETKNKIPKLYISGSEDHMFLQNTEVYANQEENAAMEIIPKCGHVCNIEESDRFNTLSISFMKKIDKISITA
ncbi:3-oxoadipate enol-lactonase 2 [Bacillus sp. THAF10]|uniref:alpha/beta fold hydrolase n=1 Tax=Bacillus sp. THAF10 TaxID=2587848 RepID=UPI001268BA9D|nr:alpha/beta hydrolase [Bacillus sp. THAF10]QFT88602.1 3-oxoadipate enol-lactonase 2 [Bacillus sp. THAF10]